MQDGVSGLFMFRPALHEPGAQTVFHRRYYQTEQAQGRAVLNDLDAGNSRPRVISRPSWRATSSPTIRHRPRWRALRRRSSAAAGICRRCTVRWTQEQRGLADAAGERQDAAGLPAVDLSRAAAAGRGRAEIDCSIRSAGQRQFAPASPAGWADCSDDWDGASALMKRIEFADALAQRLERHVAPR